MTTTDVFQGMGDKNSSRVLAAPGGKSSICFGDADDTPAAPVRRPAEPSAADAAHQSPAGQGKQADHHSHSSIFSNEAEDVGTPDNQKVKRVSKGTGDESSSDSEDEENGENSKEENVEKNPEAPSRVIAKPRRGQYNPQTGDGQSSGYNPVTGEDYDKHDFDKVSPRQKYANDQTRGLVDSVDDDDNKWGMPEMPQTRASSAKIYKNSQYRGAYNPITGELYEDSPQNANSATPSKGDQGRGDFNPITGEAYVPKKEVHTSTRVRQPPGGASSGLW